MYICGGVLCLSILKPQRMGHTRANRRIFIKVKNISIRHSWETKQKKNVHIRIAIRAPHVLYIERRKCVARFWIWFLCTNRLNFFETNLHFLQFLYFCCVCFFYFFVREDCLFTKVLFWQLSILMATPNNFYFFVLFFVFRKLKRREIQFAIKAIITMYFTFWFD